MDTIQRLGPPYHTAEATVIVRDIDKPNTDRGLGTQCYSYLRFPDVSELPDSGNSQHPAWTFIRSEGGTKEVFEPVEDAGTLAGGNDLLLATDSFFPRAVQGQLPSIGQATLVLSRITAKITTAPPSHHRSLIPDERKIDVELFFQTWEGPA